VGSERHPHSWVQERFQLAEKGMPRAHFKWGGEADALAVA